MKENKILKWTLILSAVILSNLFFNYSLQLAFNVPEYDNFCPGRMDSQDLCEEKGGEWVSSSSENEPVFRGGNYCDTKDCYEKYDTAREEYAKKVFISLIAIGVFVLIISFIVKNTVLTSALALTALLNFVIASFRYWQYSDELLKVAILFVALVTIFYMIVKKFKHSI